MRRRVLYQGRILYQGGTLVILVVIFLPIRGNKGIRYANTTQKVRRQWNAREKLIIIMYHEKGHSKRATATKFGIEPKQLRDWISKKTELLNAHPGIRRLHQGPPPKFPEFEIALVFWIRERRAKGNIVTRYMVQMKAKEMVKQRKWQIRYPDIKSSVFSNKWVDGVLSRNNLCNRRRTTVAQRLPDTLNELQHEFLSFVLYRRIEYCKSVHLCGKAYRSVADLSSRLP